MRIDSVCDIRTGMAENAAFCVFVGLGIIHEGRKGMSTVVGRVDLAMDPRHDGFPERAIRTVRIGASVRRTDQKISRRFQSRKDQRPNKRMDRNDPYPADGL